MKILFFLILLFGLNTIYGQEIKPKCLDGNCKNKIGTYIYADSSVYVGSFVDKLRSGQGKITYRNKSLYDGQWMNDKRNGNGVYIDSIGNKYEGLWMDDKENGKGKYTDLKGNVYEGSWTNGALIGYITLRYKNKSLYEGEYNNGIRGKGKFTYSDGSVYTGNFAKNKRSGYGELVNSFDLTYKGNWVSNEVDGQGEFYLTSSQVKIAEGVWKTDKTNPSDSKFISSDGLMVCYYANKNLYYGKSQEGMPNGIGTMKYAIGDVYEGNFVKGIYNGYGRLKLKDNSEYKGDWKNGEKDGFGTLTKADKSAVKGYWKYDNYKGVELPDNTPKMVLRPVTCESNREGNLELDRFIEVGNCINGLRDGEWKEVDSEGKIHAIYNYKKGVKDGSFINYHYTNRTISSKQFYKDGLLEGYCFEYFEKGLIKSKIKFTNGIMDSAYYYSISREDFDENEYYLKRVVVLDTSLLNLGWYFKFNSEEYEYGKYTDYYSNGSIRAKGFSTGHNDQYGKETEYDKNGKVTSEIEYESFEEHCFRDPNEIRNGWVLHGNLKDVYRDGFLIEVYENNILTWKRFGTTNTDEYIVNGNNSQLNFYKYLENENYDEKVKYKTIYFKNNKIDSEIENIDKEESYQKKITFDSGARIKEVKENNLNYQIIYLDKEFKNESFRQVMIRNLEIKNTPRDISNSISMNFDDVYDIALFLSFMNNGQFKINGSGLIDGKKYLLNKYILNGNMIDSVYVNNKLLSVSNVNMENINNVRCFYPNGQLKSIVNYDEFTVNYYENYNNAAYHLLEGEIYSYYENGAIQLHGIFKENNLVGKLNYSNPDGVIKSFTLEEIYNSRDEKLKELLLEISPNL